MEVLILFRWGLRKERGCELTRFGVWHCGCLSGCLLLLPSACVAVFPLSAWLLPDYPHG